MSKKKPGRNDEKTTETYAEWASKPLCEAGLGRAGVTLWRWHAETDDLEIRPGVDESSPYDSLPLPVKWETIVHQRDRKRLLEAWKTFERTSFSTFDCYFRLAVEEPRWVHARDFHVEEGEPGEPKTVTGIFFDVTESELAKQKLFWGIDRTKREGADGVSAARLRSEQSRHEEDGGRISRLMDQCYHEFMSLFSFSDLPAFRKNSDLVTTDVNTALANLLGMAREEIINRPDEEVWGTEAGENLLRQCGYTLRGETVLANTTRSIQGEEMLFLDQLYPDWGPNHRIIGVCGILAPRPPESMLTEDAAEIKKAVSSPMQAVYQQAHLAAQYSSAVLLTGESGTGKDYLARRIHALSKGSEAPFENLNCGALQKELVGSELFGHEAGAFTGAKGRRKGIFELAGDGTIFLNEIGEMPLDLQPRLLTVLEDREFKRIGGEQTVRVNAGIIAATNRDLQREVDEGRFRKDLYHRISVFSIRVPPLRERTEELPALIDTLIQRLEGQMRLESLPEIDPAAMRKLRSHSWPGNIRELRNVLERAIITAQGTVIRPDHIVFPSEYSSESVEESPRTHRRTPRKPLRVEEAPTTSHRTKPPPHEVKALYEEYIVRRGWSRQRLAKHLGKDGSTVKKWFKEAGLPAGRAGRPKKKADA